MIDEKPLVGAQALPSGAPDAAQTSGRCLSGLLIAQINPGLAVADLKPIG
jgi:hypothetical protein